MCDFGLHIQTLIETRITEVDEASKWKRARRVAKAGAGADSRPRKEIVMYLRVSPIPFLSPKKSPPFVHNVTLGKCKDVSPALFTPQLHRLPRES